MNPENQDSQRKELERLSAIIDGAVDALIVIDIEGRIVLANPASERLFGYSVAALVGANVGMLMPPEEGARHDDYVKRYIETGEKRIIGTGRDVEAVTASGQRIPVHIAVSEVRIEGRLLFAGFFRNLSKIMAAERELREEGARLAAVLDTAVDAIITIDERGVIETANEASMRMFGYSEDELIGANVKMLMPPPIQEEHDGYLSAYAETGVAKIIGVGRTVEAMRRDGSRFPAELAVSKVKLGDHLTYTGILRDITDRREAERKLIEQASLAKLGELIAEVAHEVKNPLAGIVGTARVLEKRLESGSSERKACEEMIARTLSLADSVNDILEFARPKSLNLRDVPLEMLIDDSVASVRYDDRFGNLEFTIDSADIHVRCDPDQIKSVILNLLLNAAEALEGSGRIVVGAKVVDHVCHISVADDGPGIPEDRRERAFEPFFTTKGAGTGLGLAIAKRIIELHNGRIVLECPESGGTHITIELPES